MKPFLSVIIPIFNVEKYLAASLDSLLSQYKDDVEIIAIDDCSTDFSLEVLRKYSEKYPVEMVSSKENQGLGLIRNKGLKMARGEYILFLDSDDRLNPGLIDILRAHRGPEIIVFDYIREWENGLTKPNPMAELLAELSPAKIDYYDVERKKLLFKNINVAWNKAYRRDFLINNNLTFLSGYYEDVSFNYKCIILAAEIKILPFVGYRYIQREGSILNSRSDRHLDILKQYNDLLLFLFSGADYTVFKGSVLIQTIEHIFNLLMMQNYRLTSKSEEGILRGTRAILNGYGVKSCNFNRLVKVKFLYIKYTPKYVHMVLSRFFVFCYRFF
jgi:glycosyltransferase involved in cell wall biosynthesis